MASVSPVHLGPGEPAEIPGLILCPPRPPPAARVLRELRGSRSKGRTSGTGTPEGRLGEGRGSHTFSPPPLHGAHPWLGVQQRQGRPSGEWRHRRERSQCSPCPLGRQGACCAPGPNPPPSEAPWVAQSPSSAPAPHLGPRLYTHSKTPSSYTGPKRHPHTLTRAQPSNPGTAHSRGPLGPRCLSPSRVQV